MAATAPLWAASPSNTAATLKPSGGHSAAITTAGLAGHSAQRSIGYPTSMANAMAPAQSVIDFQRRLQQRRLIKTLDDLACAAVDAGRIVATTEMARGDAAADLQDMAMAGGLVAKHGDDMVTGCIGAGLYLGEKEAEERLEKTHLHEKALSSDTDRMRPKLRTVTGAALYRAPFSPIAFFIPVSISS